jgi:hypothetical protein
VVAGYLQVSVVSHIRILNIAVCLMILTGSALLFLLRKSAFYLFCSALAVNCLLAVWLFAKFGWFAGPSIITLMISIGIPLILCLYSRHLTVKGILK